MTHIMLDIETWGKTPGCDIRSIGAVVFDPVAGFVGMECSTCDGGRQVSWSDGGNCTDCLNTRTDIRGDFYIATDNPLMRDMQIDGNPRKYKLTRDPETVQWWSAQSPEAQAAFANPVALRTALGNFQTWFCEFDNGNMQSSKTLLWCNGPHFDEAILAAAFRAVGLDVPWDYRAPRDFRTITDAAGMTREDYTPFEHGTAHNALDDAISQAKIVCEAYRRLGLQK